MSICYVILRLSSGFLWAEYSLWLHPTKKGNAVPMLTGLRFLGSVKTICIIVKHVYSARWFAFSISHLRSLVCCSFDSGPCVANLARIRVDVLEPETRKQPVIHPKVLVVCTPGSSRHRRSRLTKSQAIFIKYCSDTCYNLQFDTWKYKYACTCHWDDYLNALLSRSPLFSYA